MPSKAAYLRYQRQRTPPNSATKTSAAKRVLAQPKLLENILLHLCKCETVRGIPLKAPVTKLSVLQRVNTLFQATIRGSLALARLMWLYPPRVKTVDEICASQDLQDLYMAPLEWFFDIIGNPITNRRPERFGIPFETEMVYEFNTQDIVNASEGLKDCRKRGFKHGQASWRAMVAFNAIPRDPEETFRIEYAVTELVNVRLGRQGSGRSGEYEATFEDEYVEIDGNDTLGVVFDQWLSETNEDTERQADVIRQ